MEKKMENLNRIKPYGDKNNDGIMQFSFTLPIPPSATAREAALQLCEKMGLKKIRIAQMKAIANNFSFFVIYADTIHDIDLNSINVTEIDMPHCSREEINALIRDKIGRKLILIGACTGYDAHTVGIDSIFNMKGFSGDYGLERYEWFETRNLGAQVLNKDLLSFAISMNADAILVSKIVTQHDIHIKDLKDLIERAEGMGIREKMIFLVGGPRITHKLAVECGFDAGFGIDAKPSDAANFIVSSYLARMKKLKTSTEVRDDDAQLKKLSFK